MYKMYERLIKKAIILFIITFLPLGTYLYLNKEVQTAFISNIDINQYRYILNTEFNPIENKISIFEKIIFNNETNKKMDKIYLYIGDNKITIKDVRINKLSARYKIIGNDNILMVISNVKIGPQEVAKIEIDYVMGIESNKGLNENSNNYDFGIWYPVILYYDNYGWDLESVFKNAPNILEGNHHIKIFVPSEYTLDMTNAKNNNGFYQMNETDKTYVPITIRNIYEESK